jgi:hypothetical protein
LLGSGGAAFVAVGQATDLTRGHNWPEIPSLNRSWFWRVLLQRQMRSRSVVGIEIGSKDSPQRAFMEHDHVVETFAPDRSDHSFHISPLPGRGWCRENLCYRHSPDLFSEALAKNRVAISQEVARKLVERKSIPRLRAGALGGRMAGHMEVNDATMIMGQN